PNAREPASDRILAPLSLLRVPPPPNSTLFPYTTLFRSQTVPIPLASGTYAGLTVPPDYNPNQINPYTGQPFGPPPPGVVVRPNRSEEHTSELQSRGHLVCRLLLEKKNI